MLLRGHGIAERISEIVAEKVAARAAKPELVVPDTHGWAVPKPPPERDLAIDYMPRELPEQKVSFEVEPKRSFVRLSRLSVREPTIVTVISEVVVPRASTIEEMLSPHSNRDVRDLKFRSDKTTGKSNALASPQEYLRALQHHIGEFAYALAVARERSASTVLPVVSLRNTA